MAKKKFGGTIRFKELMTKTSNRLTKLSTLTSKMIEESIIALIEDDEELYKELKKEYKNVNKLRVSLEKSVVNSIALHQPFAADLRFLISSLKIANEIVRTARNAVHIAHSSLFIDYSMKCLNDDIKETVDLARRALKMYNQSITSFINRISADIEKWTKLDDEIDDLHKELIDRITQDMVCDGEATRAGVSLILAIRYIERIADHACNIAEESNYVVTSKRDSIE